MFETLRRHPLLVLDKAAREPLDALAMLQDRFYSRIEPVNAVGYIEDSDWEDALHRPSRYGISVRGGGLVAVMVYRCGDPADTGAWRSALSASTNGTTAMRDSVGPSDAWSATCDLLTWSKPGRTA